MDFEDFVKAELDSVKYPLLSRSNIDYQSGQAERVEIDLNRITSGGDRQTLRSIDYFLFQKSSGAFVIDFTTSNMESNADISTYDQIAKSFSWIEVQ